MTAGDNMGLPWATLDPTANARALMDVQMRGLRAAAQVVERLVRATDGETPAEDGSTGGDPTGESGSGWATGMDGLVDLWATMTKSWLRAMTRMSPAGQAGSNGNGNHGAGAGATAAGDRVDINVDRPAAAGPLRIRFGADAELWLHNGTDADVCDISFACTNLVSSSGQTLRPTSITFSPPVVEVLPRRSSRGVLVRASQQGKDRAADAALRYRGVIVTTGTTDLWIPVEVAAADGP